MKLRGGDPWSWADRAHCHRKLEQIDDPLEDYKNALQLAPDIACIRIGRASIYRDAEKYDEALADYKYVLAQQAIFYRRLAEQGINEIDDLGPED